MKNDKWSMNGLKVLLLSFLFTGLLSCDRGYDDWDANDNDALEENEFHEGFPQTNYYDGWDENDDNLIDQNEFYDGTYSTLDVDNDNFLSSSEWELLGDSENDYGEFSLWDTDNDALIDYNEYRENADENGVFTSWDQDDNSSLDENEFGDGVFVTWDRNKDNKIDENEYNEWESASNDTNNRAYGQSSNENDEEESGG